MKITEAPSNHNHLEMMSTIDLISNINKEDQSVAYSISKKLYVIEKVIDLIVPKLKIGGRLFYIGAGTSGRLGILDASECPPTFGVDHNLVIGLIAGGDTAIRKAVEFAEDDENQGWIDLQKHHISEKDVVIGIAASGSTPYVIGALKACNDNNILTSCITCNEGSLLAQEAKFPIEVTVGPEFVTGSTRMKSGTAQKLILNMISTACMIKLGKVVGNKMVDMQLSNNKLVERGIKMVCHATGVSEKEAKKALDITSSVRDAIKFINNE